MKMWLLALAAIAAVLTIDPAQSQTVTSPARGSSERAAVLDALRPTLEEAAGVPVIFIVGAINVMGDWAYVSVEPRRSDGGPVDWRKTKFRGDFDAGMFSRLTLALLKRENGVWTVAEHAIGPTDVAWVEWATEHKLPEVLFEGP